MLKWLLILCIAPLVGLCQEDTLKIVLMTDWTSDVEFESAKDAVAERWKVKLERIPPSAQHLHIDMALRTPDSTSRNFLLLKHGRNWKKSFYREVDIEYQLKRTILRTVEKHRKGLDIKQDETISIIIPWNRQTDTIDVSIWTYGKSGMMSRHDPIHIK